MARPKLGDSDTERLHVKMTADEISAIDDWRYANRVPSRSEAVRRLVQIAFIADRFVGPGTTTAEQFMHKLEEFDELMSGRTDGDEVAEAAYSKRFVMEAMPVAVLLAGHTLGLTEAAQKLRSGADVEVAMAQVQKRQAELENWMEEFRQGIEKDSE